MEYSFSLLVFQNKAPANINLCQGPIRTLAGSKTGVATFLNKTCEQAPGEGKKFGKWSESMNMKKKNGFEKEAAIFFLPIPPLAFSALLFFCCPIVSLFTGYSNIGLFKDPGCAHIDLVSRCCRSSNAYIDLCQ